MTRKMLTMKSLIVIGFLYVNVVACFAKDYEVLSPGGDLELIIQVNDKINLEMYLKGDLLFHVSDLFLDLEGEGMLGHDAKIRRKHKNSVDRMIYPVVPVKRSAINDRYNELELEFRNDFSLIFRLYDDAFAYRFKTKFGQDIVVNFENFSIDFKQNISCYYPTEESFLTHSERKFEHLKLASIPDDKMSCLPVLFELDDQRKMIMTEVGLIDYPGLYLEGTSSNSLHSLFPPYVLEEKQVRDRTIAPSKTASYIAKTSGKREFPWRVFSVFEKDRDIIGNDIVFRLAPECVLEETDWIKPGKVSWDWWNASINKGVDFESGVNTATYKYHIDFASKYGLEYIILDEGWSNPSDLFEINPEVDMDELIAYAKTKHVDIILWVLWNTLDRQLDEALKTFEDWGIKGIKVDFMQRDDQQMVNYYEKIARKAAEHKMLVDFHGSYKPTGIRRMYPNVMTREGVMGLEHNKWSEDITPEHNVLIPFTRMFAGPMDYTPGAIRNSHKKNFEAFFEKPMSMGTRCHQLAMYVVYESPLQMLADCPSNYLSDQDVMKFLAPVPSVWDETICLDAEVGEYILVARKSGDVWYVGAMTNSNARKIPVDFSFLEEGSYEMQLFKDGMNASKNAEDYKIIKKEITAGHKEMINMVSGGGYAAIIRKK